MQNSAINTLWRIRFIRKLKSKNKTLSLINFSQIKIILPKMAS